jgi:hypothetical protein
MANKRLVMKGTRRTAIDPAVAEILSDMDEKQAERALPARERQRKIRERAKSKARSRVMLDLPPALIARIKALANDPKSRIPESQIAALLIWQGLHDLDAGMLTLGPYKHPSRSPRYDWNLVFLDEDPKNAK